MATDAGKLFWISALASEAGRIKFCLSREGHFIYNFFDGFRLGKGHNKGRYAIFDGGRVNFFNGSVFDETTF